MYDIFESLLLKKGISAYRFSKETGISQSCISNWKCRKSKISYEYAKIIGKYFNVSPEYVMFGKEDMKSTNDYYLNEKTTKIAQEIYDNKELRILFDAASDASPEDLKTVHTMLLALKKKEQGE